MDISCYNLLSSLYTGKTKLDVEIYQRLKKRQEQNKTKNSLVVIKRNLKKSMGTGPEITTQTNIHTKHSWWQYSENGYN